MAAACPTVELVWQGRDNALAFVLLEDGRRAALSDYSRFLLEVDGQTIDSDEVGLGEGQVFDNTALRTYQGRHVQALALRLGSRGLTVGRHTARLVGYSAAAPGGLVLGSFTVDVLA